MTFVVSLQGGMAVGKTTLARNLEKKYKNIYVLYENPYPIVQKRKELNLDIRKKEGFVHNQRLFIQAEIERFKTLPGGSVLLDRGPEDIEFYTLHFPKTIGENWDIEIELNQELQELRNCRSNLILYLNAPAEILRERKEKDETRSRNSFEEQLKFYNQEKNWYKRFSTTMVLDVGFKTEQEVKESVAEILQKKNFL